MRENKGLVCGRLQRHRVLTLNVLLYMNMNMSPGTIRKGQWTPSILEVISSAIVSLKKNTSFIYSLSWRHCPHELHIICSYNQFITFYGERIKDVCAAV